MKQLLLVFIIRGASIVSVKLTKGLGRSIHLVILHCHLLGIRGDSNWCPDMSGTQTLRWSCKETSRDMQDTQSWRDGSAAEGRSSLFSTPLRCFLVPRGLWSVMWSQHSIGPFHRESAQNILAFLTNLQMYGAFGVNLPLFLQEQRTGWESWPELWHVSKHLSKSSLYCPPLSLYHLSFSLIWAITGLKDWRRNFDHSSQRVFRYELKSRILSVQQTATDQEMKFSGGKGTDCFSATFTCWVNANFSFVFSRQIEREEQILISMVVSPSQ